MSIVEEYYVDLLDAKDGLIRRLETSHGGQITLNVNRPIRGGGKIMIVDDGEPIPWMKSRFKVWHHRIGEEPMSLGVYVPTSPKLLNRPNGGVYTVGLHDKTQRLAETALPQTVSVPAGGVVTDYIEQIIARSGEKAVNITPSPLTASSAIFLQSGMSLLKAVNELLDYINYFSIWTDENGEFQGVPYSKPQDRPLSRRHEQGRGAIHLSDWEREQDILGVPNEVILLGAGDDEKEGLVGVYRNMNPDSDYSIPSRDGIVVSHVEDGVEAADQKTINELAERRCISLSSPSATFTVEHLVVPSRLNDVVRFISGSHDALAVVERLDFKMKPGELCKAVWREVVSV